MNVNFISGVLIAGDDGMERFISDTLFPAINDGIQMGEISVA